MLTPLRATALVSLTIGLVHMTPARGVRDIAPNTVTGVALDTKGAPMHGARIEIKRGFTYGQSRTTTGPDGRYRISGLVNGTYPALA